MIHTGEIHTYQCSHCGNEIQSHPEPLPEDYLSQGKDYMDFIEAHLDWEQSWDTDIFLHEEGCLPEGILNLMEEI